jgi:ribosomal protein S18 acetylase RimI-like enzyme
MAPRQDTITRTPAPVAAPVNAAPGAAWSQPAGPAGDLLVRPARPADLPALERFFERCSADTLYRRFHGVAGALAHEELVRTAHPTAHHRAVLALEGGEVRGIGTLAFGRDGEAEIAFVVEDAWMRRGVGRVLARGVVREARRLRVPHLVAYVQPDNGRARDFFRSIAPGATVRLEDRELIVDIPLAIDLVAAPTEATAPAGAGTPLRPTLAAG